ncbi:Thioesterase/thiol ester dehydrase-isomerase [Pluteus cervinus]|uniref:Thioesterase/thiol ester dehydrase-isomerase n=1 Tax=Pluteus cervinus TaxID=181527 RepID=A0ACD3AWT0_9AGAR|nr:Thioesterase/thiol ester dehydrase-isomerase [Pluteus cervinus]
MPLRTPALWSETLLTTSPPPEADQRPEGSSFVHDHTPRSMHDSYSELVLPFGSSPEFLEGYTNAAGGIRTGKLMENLDSLAGSIAYKHMLGPGINTLGPISERGFYLVTASVDRLDMFAPLNPKRDLKLSGQVIYTGRSSMEVAVRMETIGTDIKANETVLLGRFCMVCRDAFTHSSKPVNPLTISTPEENVLYSMGKQMKQRRSTVALQSLSKVPPSSEEAEDLHTYFLQHGQKAASESRVWMGDTRIENTLLMFPQERNVHQKIFGGYLMRLAYELGITNAIMFTRHPVEFLSLDGISFARPVPIGSILRLTSHILHTKLGNKHDLLVHVGVEAKVVDPKTGSEQMTNDFRFTWHQPHIGAPPMMVVPKTYKEAMLWLEGRRALEFGAEIRGH